MLRHDEQRGKQGSFEKTFGNLEALRKRYPELSITLKYTITPVNYDELLKSYEFLSGHGYRFTAKMLEYNPHYTNKLTGAIEDRATGFTTGQVSEIKRQLEAILALAPRGRRHARRVAEMQEVLDSLDPQWRRPGRCSTPKNVAFLDCDLNLFTCKEYGPVVNLQEERLDDLSKRSQFQDIVAHERQNSGQCTRCTSQMKRSSEAQRWLGYLASWAR